MNDAIKNSREEALKEINLYNQSPDAARLYLNTQTREIQTIIYQTLNEFTEIDNDTIVLLAKENSVEEKVTLDDVMRVAERSLKFLK